MSDHLEPRPIAIAKVADLDRTVDWYAAAGFEVRGRRDDPGMGWCEVGRDGTVLQFLAGDTPWESEPAFTGCIYVHVPDIDAASSELRPPVDAEWGIEDRPWGARELVLRGPRRLLHHDDRAERLAPNT